MSASLPKFVIVREAQFYAGFADVLLAAPSVARLAAFKCFVDADARSTPAAYASDDLLRRCAYAASCLAPGGAEATAAVRAWLSELFDGFVRPAASWNFFCGMACAAVADACAADAFPRLRARLAWAFDKTECLESDDAEFGDGKLDGSGGLFDAFAGLFADDPISGAAFSPERATRGLREIAGAPDGAAFDKLRPSRALNAFSDAARAWSFAESAVAVLDGDFADARALRRDLRADGFRVEKQLDASGDVEQLVVVGACSPRWRLKNVSPLMLTDFREGGVADFVAEADFRAAETEILRRRLDALQDELERFRAPQGV